MTARAALVAAAIVLAPSLAEAQAAWLRDRLDVEWVVAAGGWRSAASAGDQRAPGFDALMGGGEFVLGLDVGAGLAVVGDGRVLAGSSFDHTYFEGLGGVALQVRLGRVRLRIGPTAGESRWRGDVATLVGGFAAGSIDVFPLGTGRLSTTVSLRVDVDADLGVTTFLPESSVALALGVGVRY